MRRTLLKLVALSFGVLTALLLAEGTVRLIGASPTAHEVQFRNMDGTPVDPAVAIQRGELVSLPPNYSPLGQPVLTFGPGVQFKICYDGLRRDWLDEDGCVEVYINSAGVREREELAGAKPPGQRRIVCLGDSVTFGYGIPIEACWTRLVESELRADDDGIRTVNCGFAASQLPDEYWLGLKHRFSKFEPDAVLVTLCLNDVIGCNAGMAHLLRPVVSDSALWALVQDWWRGGRTALDPAVDYGAELLAAGPDHAVYRRDTGAAKRHWRSGTPQASLREIRDWCAARGIPVMVTLWPFFQGLEDGAKYPFHTVHDSVAAFCAAEGIPFLDLLPTFRGEDSLSLWVAPNDMHGNPKAQALAAPAIAAFVRSHLK